MAMYPCPIPTLLPNTETVDKVCGELSENMMCLGHWRRVSSGTRRDFVAERDRLRKAKQLKPSPLMRELIKRAIIEAARGS